MRLILERVVDATRAVAVDALGRNVGGAGAYTSDVHSSTSVAVGRGPGSCRSRGAISLSDIYIGTHFGLKTKLYEYIIRLILAIIGADKREESEVVSAYN
jgi:hypothetical protein